MQTNFLEELAAEWYEYQGYLVKRNERVGRNPNGKGGNQGELDVVAFNPRTRHLVHVETSTDADAWPERERRFARKFACGTTHIHSLFDGLTLPDQIDRIAVFAFGSRHNHEAIGGGKVRTAKNLISEILRVLKDVPFASRAVPEKYPILRVLQIIANGERE